MTTSQILQAARRLIEAGWCQGPFFSAVVDHKRCFCAVGAVYAVIYGPEARFEWSMAGSMAETVLDGAARCLSGSGDCDAIAYNETPGRTQAEVLALFDRALIEVTK